MRIAYKNCENYTSSPECDHRRHTFACWQGAALTEEAKVLYTRQNASIRLPACKLQPTKNVFRRHVGTNQSLDVDYSLVHLPDDISGTGIIADSRTKMDHQTGLPIP